MKAIIISYTGGLFGEFFSYKLQQQFQNLEEITTPENRYLFPNYLSAIDFRPKVFPANTSWPISIEQKIKLHTIYKDKYICIPTHWYSNNLMDCNIDPFIGIRLYSDNIKILNFAYALFWVKSYIYANEAWKDRVIEIKNLISSGHKYSKELSNLLIPGNYQSWKYISYKTNFIKNNKLDLKFYMKKHYKFYLKCNLSILKNQTNWVYYDVGKLIHGDMSNISEIENRFDINLDIDDIRSYSLNNCKIIKDKLNLELDDFSNSSWLDSLYEYSKNYVE